MGGYKRTMNVDKAERSISLRLPAKLLDKINDNYAKLGFANRTALIESACECYFDTLECPRCHNRNHKDGVICSVCGEKLLPYYRMRSKLNLRISEIYTKMNDIRDRFVKLQKNYINIDNSLAFVFDKSTYTRQMISENLKQIENTIKSTTIPKNMDYLKETGYIIWDKLRYSNRLVDTENQLADAVSGVDITREAFLKASTDVQMCYAMVESYYDSFKSLSVVYRGIKEMHDKITGRSIEDIVI